MFREYVIKIPRQRRDLVKTFMFDRIVCASGKYMLYCICFHANNKGFFPLKFTGPSRFIIMRPGRPTRVIESVKREDGTMSAINIPENVEVNITANQHQQLASINESDIILTDEVVNNEANTNQMHDLPAIDPDSICEEVSELGPSSPNPSGTQCHVTLEHLDDTAHPHTVTTINLSPSLTKIHATDDTTSIAINENSLTPSPLSFNNQSSSPAKTCDCDVICKQWSNYHSEDVVTSPLLSSLKNASAISCAKCASSDTVNNHNGNSGTSSHRSLLPCFKSLDASCNPPSSS